MKKQCQIILIILFLTGSVYSQNNNVDKLNKISTSSMSNYLTESTERILTSGVIVLEISILLLTLYYFKKTRAGSKQKVKSIYKKNIIALRDEKIIPLVDKKNTKKRKKISGLIKLDKINGANISKKAKQFNLSKGEIYLAKRIQRLYQEVA